MIYHLKWIFVSCCLLFWGSISLANPLYEILHIDIETANNNANIAKQQAVQLAKQRAFDLLLNRLTFLEDEGNRLPPAPEKLETLIRDLVFDEEKFGGGIYQARISVRFNVDAVRLYFQENRLKFSETSGPILTVIPMLELGTQTLIWQQDNPMTPLLRQAIMERPPALVSLTAPNPAIDHARLIDQAELITVIRQFAQNPRQEQPNSLLRLQTLYENDGFITLNIKISRFGIADLAEVLIVPMAEKWRQPAIPLRYTGNPGEPRAQFLSRIIEVALEEINQIWKTRTFVNPDEALTKIRIYAPLNDFSEWLRLKQTLNRLSGIERTKLHALRTNEVWMEIAHRGGVRQFALGLASNGYRLSEDNSIAGAEYIITHQQDSE